MAVTVTAYPNLSKCHPLNKLVFMYDEETVYANHRERIIDIIDKDNIHTGFDYRTFLRHRLKFADFNVANYWLHNKSRYKFDFGSFYTHENFPYFYPLQKMVERARSIEFEKINTLISMEDFGKFHNDFTEVFYNLEKVGIRVDEDIFKRTFDVRDFPSIVYKERVYQNYNFFTTTSRPSNAINNVNYAALTTEQRKCFIPKNDIFVEFDFESYHPRLISKLIDYDFGDVYVYNKLADDLGVSNGEAKNITFQNLYGGIRKEVLQRSKFFEGVDGLIKVLYDEYFTHKFIKSHIYKRPMKMANLGDLNPQKLFNYYIQSYETERNVILLKEIHNYLLNKGTDIVLYNYDSFLFDYSKKDGKKLLKDIKRILEDDGFVVKMKTGKNYGEMSENTSIN